MTMGVHRVKGCCVLDVCVVTSVGQFSNSESSNVKKGFSKLFLKELRYSLNNFATLKWWGLGGPKVAETHAPKRRGPRESHSG